MNKILKKMLTLMLALCMLGALGAPALAAGSNVRLQYLLTAGNSSSVAVRTGDEITVTFSIKRTDSSDSYKLNAMDNDIEYDESFFEPVGDITVHKGGHAVAAYDRRLTGNQPIIRLGDMVGEYADEEIFCSFKMKVIAGGGSSTLRCSEELAYDNDGRAITVTASNLTVTVSGGGSGLPASGEETKDDKDKEPFIDVTKADWFNDSVLYVYNKGLMDGVADRIFDPNGTTTRGMVVTILHRLEGKPAAGKSCTFKDVPDGEWYADAVHWAQSSGIVEGYDDETFGPQDPVTREQMAAILYRYAAYKKIDTSARGDLSAFEDQSRISAWALDNVKWANAVGLMQGRSDSAIVPQGHATRAELAALFMRLCENVLK